MRPALALPLLLMACAPQGPGFAGGGTPREETWWGSDDTAVPPLDDDDLLDCMARGGVEDVGGAVPPDIQGAYDVSGQLVASDSELPVGTATGGQLCIRDQDTDGGIALRESAAGASTWTVWGLIRGEGARFTLWLELEGDDPWDADCVVRALSAVSGVRSGDDLELRTATVAVGYEDCEGIDDATLGACWATAADATRDGDCGD
ncbi:MAG: hypothetical protein ABIO70_15675 [Pseudomonadota bacterium]